MCELTTRLMYMADDGHRLNVEARGMCEIDIRRIDGELTDERRKALHYATFYPGTADARYHADRVAQLERARGEIVAFLAEPIWD